MTRRLGRPPRTAFVLSGGGNLGAVQVGMLRALVDAGIRPDLVIGCSVGAINGAGFAAEPDERGVARLDRIWRRLADGDPDLMPSTFLPVVAQMARKGEALHDPERLAQLLDEELQTHSFSGLAVPFHCVATDLEAAGEHWFDRGRLVPALLASAALPAVYPAVDHGGRSLIDGGVLNEIHTARAVELGATELYVLHVGHLESRMLDVQRPFDSAMRAYWTARRFRLEEDLKRIPPHCVVHRLPAGSSPQLRFNDFTRADELIDLARAATAEFLRTGHAPAPVTGPISEPETGDDDPDLDGEQILADEASDGTANATAGAAARGGQRFSRAFSRLSALPGSRENGAGTTEDTAEDTAEVTAEVTADDRPEVTADEGPEDTAEDTAGDTDGPATAGERAIDGAAAMTLDGDGPQPH